MSPPVRPELPPEPEKPGAQPERTLYDEFLADKATESGPGLYEMYLGSDPRKQPEVAPEDGSSWNNQFVVGLRSMGRRILPSIGQAMQSAGESMGAQGLRSAGSWLETATTRRPLVGRVPRMADVVSRDRDGSVDWTNTIRSGIDYGTFQVGSGLASTAPMLALAAAGQPGMAIAAGASQNIGESREAMIEAGVDPEMVGPASLGTGAAMTGLDYLPVGRLVGRMRRGVTAAVTPGVGPAAIARRIATETAKQGAFEGLTEGAQTIVQEGGKFAALGRMPTREEALAAGYESVESAVAGGLTGAAMGGGAQTFQEARNLAPGAVAAMRRAGPQVSQSISNFLNPPGARQTPASPAEAEAADFVQRSREVVDRAAGFVDREQARRAQEAPDPLAQARPDGKPKVDPELNASQRAERRRQKEIREVEQSLAENPNDPQMQARLDQLRSQPAPPPAPPSDPGEAEVQREIALDREREAASLGIDADQLREFGQMREEQPPEVAGPATATEEAQGPPRAGRPIPLSESEMETVLDLERRMVEILNAPMPTTTEEQDQMAVEYDELEQAVKDIMGSVKYEDQNGVPYRVPEPEGSEYRDYRDQIIEFQTRRAIATGAMPAPQEAQAAETQQHLEAGTTPEIPEVLRDAYAKAIEMGVTLPPTPLEVDPDSRAAQTDPSLDLPEGKQALYLASAEQMLRHAEQVSSPEFIQKVKDATAGKLTDKERETVRQQLRHVQMAVGTLNEIDGTFGREAADHLAKVLGDRFPEFRPGGLYIEPQAVVGEEPAAGQAAADPAAGDPRYKLLDDLRSQYRELWNAETGGAGMPGRKYAEFHARPEVDALTDQIERLEEDLGLEHNEQFPEDVIEPPPAAPAAPETLTEAALRNPADGKIYAVPLLDGGGHLGAWNKLLDEKLGLPPGVDRELRATRMAESGLGNLRRQLDEGFITSRGRFVDRQEATAIARAHHGVPTPRYPSLGVIAEELADAKKRGASAPASIDLSQLPEPTESTESDESLLYRAKGGSGMPGILIALGHAGHRPVHLPFQEYEESEWDLIDDIEEVLLEAWHAGEAIPRWEEVFDRFARNYTVEQQQSARDLIRDAIENRMKWHRRAAKPEKARMIPTREGIKVQPIDEQGRDVGEPYLAGQKPAEPRKGDAVDADQTARRRELAQMFDRLQNEVVPQAELEAALDRLKGEVADAARIKQEAGGLPNVDPALVPFVRAAEALEMAARVKRVVPPLPDEVDAGDVATLPDGTKAEVEAKDDDVVVLSPKDGPNEAVTWAGVEDAAVTFEEPAETQEPAEEAKPDVTEDDGRGEEPDAGARGVVGGDPAPETPAPVLPGEGEGTREDAGAPGLPEGAERGDRVGAVDGDGGAPARADERAGDDARGEGADADDAERGDPAEGGEGDGAVTRAAPERVATEPADAGVGVRLGPGAINALIPSGVKSRIRHNIAVIRLLRRLEAEGRAPTWDEKRTMLGWVGWGGAWQVFEDQSEPHKTDLAPERAELLELLGEKDYAAARASTVNAHYTSEPVVRGLHALVARLGAPARARILEPSAGIGHFMTFAPEALGDARWTAVELDPTTGAILGHLHPEQDVRVQGFEKLKGREDSFDVVVGNVPFGNYPIADPKYDHLKVNVHDYFIAKAIDQVRPGGVVAVITSAFTMDSRKGQKFRQHLAERANLLGAIRLPSSAFKANAATEVVTDVLVFQRKADGVKSPGHAWLKSVPVKIPGGGTIHVNEFFSQNPAMVLGVMSDKGTMYGKGGMTVTAPRDIDLQAQIVERLEHFPENVIPDRPRHEATDEEAVAAKELPLEAEKSLLGRLREGEMGFEEETESFVIKQGGTLEPVEVPKKHQERIRGYVKLRDLYRESLALQRTSADEDAVQESIAKVRKQYQALVKKYGPITEKKVSATGRVSMPNLTGLPAMGSDRPLLMSLENAIDRGSTIEYVPSRALSERTLNVKPEMRASTAAEGLVLSLDRRGRVDLAWIGDQVKKSVEQVREELGDQIHWNPLVNEYESSARFLSGDVREKLEAVKHAIESGAPHQVELEKSRKALESSMPEPLGAAEIGIELGADFVPAETYEAFAKHLFGDRIKMTFVPSISLWNLEAPASMRRSPASRVQWGTERMPGTDLLEKAMQGRSPTVYDQVRDEFGRDRRVKNPHETALALTKYEAIREEWQKWVHADENRLAEIVGLFNEQMTRYRRPEFDGSHLQLPGTSQFYKGRAFSWQKHQRDAIARILESRSALLAHAVGAGKTFTIAGAMMEGRRLGRIRRPVIVVPKHLVEQFASEWQTLYPEAKLLVTSADQVSKEERQGLAARIVSGDWDGIIISHSSFERMAMSPAFVEASIAEEMKAIADAISDEKARTGKKTDTVKQLEQAMKRAQAAMDRMLNKFQKDDLIAFDELGIDALVVDEAHLYKNLWAFSRRQEVAVNFTARAFDMYLKTKHLHDTKGTIVFSTGTPVSNALFEVHAMMRYLQPEALRKLGASPMDGFLDKFASVVTKIEMSPEGGRFRQKQRVAKYNNLKPLVAAFAQVADVKMASDLWPEPTPEQVKQGFKRMRPPLEGGRPKISKSPPTAVTKSYIRHLMARADAVRGGKVDPTVDNMLKITSEGRKLALDPRLLDPRAGVPKDGVIEKAADDIARRWRESSEYRGAQLVFSDLGVPRTAKEKREAIDREEKRDRREQELMAQGLSEDEIMEKLHEENLLSGDDTTDFADEGMFSVYDELREQLVARGIPREQVAFIHEANTDQRKADLFKRVNAGLVRVLVGSTEKMGAGTNVQERLVALHHLDVPWRPSDVEQREGRIIRQGNELFNNGTIPSVAVVRYITEGTFSTYMWETVERKAGFISQLWTGAGVNTVDELGGAIELTAAEIKAVASGNPLAVEVAGLKQEVAQLEQKVTSARSSREAAKKRAARYRQDLEFYRNHIKTTAQDEKAWKPTKGDQFSMVLDDKKFTERKLAAEYLEKVVRDAIRRVRGNLGRKEERLPIGEIGGFRVELHVRMTLAGEFEQTVTMTGPSGAEYTANGEGGLGLILSMERTGSSLDASRMEMEAQVERIERELAQVEELSKGSSSEEERALLDKRADLEEKQKQLEASGEGDNVEYVPTLPERSSAWWEAVRNGEIPYKKVVKQQDGSSVEERLGVMDPFTAAILAFRARRRQSRSQNSSFGSLWEPDDDEVRARMEAADGLMRKPAVTKLKEAWGRVKSGLRHFKFLDEKASPLNAQLYEILLQVERAPATAKVQAYNLISRVSEGLSPEEAKLLARWLAVQDIQKDVEAGLYGDPSSPATMRELPFGFDPDSLENAHRELTAAVGKSPKVLAAARLREKLVGAVTRELVRYDLLPDAVLDDPRYFHRQVLTYFNAVDDDAAWSMGLKTGSGTRVQVGKKGYQQSRVGGSDFNLRYHEAEFEWLAQAFRQLHTTKALERIEAMSDIRRDLAATARANNRQAWRDLVLDPIRKQLEAQGASDAEIAEAMHDADPSLPFRRRKAIGFRTLYQAIATGQVALPMRFREFETALLAAYTDWEFRRRHGDPSPFDFHHPDLWRVLSDLAMQPAGPGSMGARTVFKAIREEEAEMKRALGRKYIDRSNAESLLKLAPEGYTTWQPVKGNYFFRAVSIEQRVVDEVLAGQRALQEEDVRAVMAIGGPRETWIIPADLAAQLEKFGERRERSVIEAAFAPVTKRWKWWTLHAPHRFLKYTMNNAFGDLDATVLYPKIMTLAPTAAADLSRAARAGKADPALLEELERLQLAGVISNTLSVTEIPDVSSLPEFQYLIHADPIRQMNVLGRYVHAVDVVNAIRENTLRLAAYRWALAEFKAGRPLAGASDKKVMAALGTEEERAALFARDLLGDYQAVSRAGQALAQGPLPFFRWIEVNAKRYVNLARNIRYEGHLRASNLAAAAGYRSAVFTAGQAVRVTALANAFLVLQALWNGLMFPEEDEILRRQGITGYIILGRDGDGNIIRLRAEGAFADFLNWVGLGDWPAMVADAREGALEAKDVLADALWSPVNRIYGSWEPFTKEIGEQLLGRHGWPDVRQARPVREKGIAAGAARIFGMTSLYRRVTGRPVPRGVDPLLWIAYRVDAEEASYFIARDMVREYRESQGRSVGRAPEPDEKANALYYHRQALRFGDAAAAERWLRKYYELGGTREGASRSVQTTTHPLSGIPLLERNRFRRSLTPEERALVDEAEAWWDATYRRARPASPRSLGVPRPQGDRR